MLQHFIDAQADTFALALSELERGKKQGHWMWFTFPQLLGLGHSEMSQRFSLTGLSHAREYFSHPVLGSRLREATKAILKHRGIKTAYEILSSPDDLKFRSCMTLFKHAAPDEPIFSEVILEFYRGHEDPETLRRLL
ncbi:DUF1810 domain-containing protein [Devosia sp. Leaf64]|uniref:DUF1810 domain-containing protein n=1 Tax=Devosia sp. Leaf64 TaxID=1736229 RepID=UPI000712EE73|nr:DUF1810 domain-containing protein [Devosia sp. Leaf64]KQN74771.1 calpastatin [Devosia sp. Leaf64]